LLVMFFVTCDDFIPFGPAEEKVEYTDVEYSEDGSTVTVYLDGKGVPVTKAQRAITRDLAKMAYDYFEVVFIGKAGASQIVARAQWELGQTAGISGVERDIDYRWSTATTATYATPEKIALMFVGKKDDKTLLGVGQIAEVDHSAKLPSGTDPKDWAEAIKDTSPPNGLTAYGTFVPGLVSGSGSLPSTVYAYISSNSTSITFYVEAVKTGLLVDKEFPKDDTTHAAVYTTENLDILTDSFNFTGDATTITPTKPAGTTGYANRIGHSKRQNPGNGNTDYPIYSLPDGVNDVQLAIYEFKGAPAYFAKGIKYVGDVVKGTSPNFKADDGIAIEKRFPRYLVGGRYLQLKESVDTDTTVELDVAHTDYAKEILEGSSLNPVVPLKFITLGSGVFSFYIEIPVYMLTNKKGTNHGDLQPIKWKLRTGLGSELYSLDSGKSSGGCVLMGIGDIDLDWLEIYWEWLK